MLRCFVMIVTARLSTQITKQSVIIALLRSRNLSSYNAAKFNMNTFQSVYINFIKTLMKNVEPYFYKKTKALLRVSC